MATLDLAKIRRDMLKKQSKVKGYEKSSTAELRKIALGGLSGKSTGTPSRSITHPPMTKSKEQSADFLKATRAKLTGTGGLQHQMQQSMADYSALQKQGVDPSWAAMDALQFARDRDVQERVGGPSGTKIGGQFDTVYQDPSKSYVPPAPPAKVDEKEPITAADLIAFHQEQQELGKFQGLTDADIREMSRYNEAALRDIKPGSNPHRRPIRKFDDDVGGQRNYDPEKDGLPENMGEVRLAQIWVREANKQLSGIKWRDAVLDEFGKVMEEAEPGGYYRAAYPQGQAPGDYEAYGRGGLKTPEGTEGATQLSYRDIPITTQDLAKLDLIAAMNEEIDYIREADLTFRNQESIAHIGFQYQEQAAEMAQSFALQMQNVTNQAEWNLMQQNQQSRLAELDVQRVAATEMANLQSTLDTGMLDKEGELETALQKNQQEYQGEQNRLDRAIQRQEYEEGARASQAVERLRQKEIDLQQQQFQLTLFMTLAQSPEILYFLKNAGALDMFGDIMGDGGQALDEIIGRVGEQQAGGDTGIGNIQQLSRLSSTEQDRQMYALSAQTGSRDPISMLRGSAPMALTNPVDPNAPLLGGAPPTSMTVSNRGSTASTPLSLSREGGVPPQSPASSALPSSGVRVQGSGSMRPTAAMGQMENIIKEYQEGRYSAIDGTKALEDIALSNPFTEDTFEMLVRLTMSMTNEPYAEAADRIMRGPIGDWRYAGIQARGR